MTIERPGGSVGDNGANDPQFHDGLASVMDWEAEGGASQTYLNSPEGLNEVDPHPEYIARHLVASLKRLQDKDRTHGFDPTSETQEKALAIFDQLADYPEAVEEFLNHPDVSESPMFENQPVLEALPARLWGNEQEGVADSTIRLLAFALKRSAAPVDVVQAFADSAWPAKETQLERLEAAMNLVGFASDILTPEENMIVVDAVASAIAIKKEVIKAEQARIARVEAEKQRQQEETQEDLKRQSQANINEQAFNSKAQAENQKLLNESWYELSDALIKDPEQTYWKCLDGKQPVHADKPLAFVSVSSRYLAVTNGEGNRYMTQQALEALNVHLQLMLVGCDVKNHLSSKNAFDVIKPHLHRFFPDLESLEKLIVDYPGLRSDGEFFTAWKKAFTDDKLRKNAEALVGTFGPELLKNHDIEKLDIKADKCLGVAYSDEAEMYDDLQKYFIRPIGGVPVGGHVGHLPAWSIDNMKILQHITHELDTLSVSRFAPKHMHKQATSDMKKDQWFNLTSRKGPDGQAISYLQFDDVQNFAAYVDKEVEYDTQSEARIKMNLTQLPVFSEEDKKRLHDQYQQSGVEPRAGSLDLWKQGGSASLTESWSLRHNKRPNQTIASLLNLYLGEAKIAYSLDDSKELVKLDNEPVPEVDHILKVTFNSGGGTEAVQSRTITRENVAQFKVSTTAEQAKRLHALKHAVLQARGPLPRMLY
jgi:hypothetical protein